MISTNLSRLRRLHGFTQEQAAEAVGVSRQAVAKWESGESLPDLESCVADVYKRQDCGASAYASVGRPKPRVAARLIVQNRRTASREK